MGSPRRPVDVSVPRKFGNAAEKGMTKAGYKRTPGSGSGAVKGDLRYGDFMVEVKATTRASYSVTAETLAKLRNDGLTNGKPGVLVVHLGDGTKLAVMELHHFEQLAGR